MSRSIQVPESTSVNDGPVGEERQNIDPEKIGKSVNSMLPPSLVLVALCLHGAHILRGDVLSGLVRG